MLRKVSDAAAGMAFEHALFVSEGPQIGLWTAEGQGLVCPGAYERRPGFEDAVERSAARGWPVHLRPTGGGTVPQGPGVDNIALAFNAPKGDTIEDGYRLLTNVIREGFGEAGHALRAGDTPGSFCDGAWNLSVEGKKIVGTAQRWRPNRGGKPRVLAHALILTTDTFQRGAEAVSAFHVDLGLSPIVPGVHTSIQAAFGKTELPLAALQTAAEQALVVLEQKSV